MATPKCDHIVARESRQVDPGIVTRHLNRKSKGIHYHFIEIRNIRRLLFWIWWRYAIIKALHSFQSKQSQYRIDMWLLTTGIENNNNNNRQQVDTHCNIYRDPWAVQRTELHIIEGDQLDMTWSSPPGSNIWTLVWVVDVFRQIHTTTQLTTVLVEWSIYTLECV